MLVTKISCKNGKKNNNPLVLLCILFLHDLCAKTLSLIVSNVLEHIALEKMYLNNEGHEEH